MKDIFKLKVTPYIVRGYFRLDVPMVDTTTYGLHSLQYTAAEFKNTLWKHMTNVP